ncbi:MAG TPA: DinB family protein [Candidatus Acidoferrum sp.]
MKKKKTIRKAARKPTKKASPKPPRNMDRELREQVVYLLKGGGAHVHFTDALEGFPAEKYGAFADGLPHTGWQLLEHARLAQWDILEFSRNRKHVSPPFPAGYWPKTPAPPDRKDWDESVAAFQRDLLEMVHLVVDPRTDLSAKIPHGEGQTVLREALLLADHNAYHLGQLVDLRRALGTWPET